MNVGRGKYAYLGSGQICRYKNAHKKREKLVNVGKGKCGACGGGRHDLTRGATLPQCGGDRVKASYLSLQNYCYYCYLVFLVIIILI